MRKSFVVASHFSFCQLNVISHVLGRLSSLISVEAKLAALDVPALVRRPFIGFWRLDLYGCQGLVAKPVIDPVEDFLGGNRALPFLGPNGDIDVAAVSGLWAAKVDLLP